MPELSNRDIDHIFQQGADRYDFEFKEEAWQQMESLLERNRRRRLLWWWLLGILLSLLLAFGVYRWLWNLSSNDTAPSQGERPPVAVDIPKTAPRNPGITAAPGKEAEKVSKEKADQRSGESSEGKASASPPPKEPVLPSSAVADNSDLAVASGRLPRDTGKEARSGEAAPLEKLPFSDVPFPERPPIPLRSTAAVVEKLPHRRIPTLTNAFATLPAPALPSLPAAGDPPPPNTLAFGFTVTPESASIGTDDFGNVDFKGGISLEYRFATHFGVGAGVFYTRKHYEAGPGEYTPEKGFWTRQIAPVKTSGYCSMLEVPLYATYFLRRHDRNSLFLEAGLTNFLMLNEHYWYSYDRPDPDLIHYWKSNLDYHTWMGILNISPGYQAALSPRFGIQAAPFIQIPLTGVGNGRVDLYSIGLNLRVMFRTPVSR